MRTQRVFLLISMWALLASSSLAQTQQARKQAIAPAAGSTPVVGSGTPGQITKWTGVSGTSTYSIGGSNIFEDKFGKVGIGTSTPTSLLTVQGMIETTLGGYKFPDGTLQTTAFIPNQVVRSLNGLTGDLTLAAGANITITPSGNTLTIAATNALTGVAHDATLQGNGSGASPLGVAAPLTLSGSLGGPVISATNSASSAFAIGVYGKVNTGDGVRGEGKTEVAGFGSDGAGLGIGGLGVFGRGGSAGGLGGDGVAAVGGDSGGLAGLGVNARGGNSSTSDGGHGVLASGGGGGVGKTGGDGVFANGGSGSNLGGAGVTAEGGNSSADNGGHGVEAFGGGGSGVGKTGGDGIFAQRGTGSNGATNGRAGTFVGDVLVQGNFSATGAKMFKIDHPLDPENKYLNHAAIESSEVLDIYSGNITTDQNGDAIIGLPEWFEAVNQDFRYQLTVVGQFAQAIVANKIQGNRFMIKTNAPNVEVSWQVTGVRSDAVMKKYTFKAEEEKAERERGYYLTPEVFNQPEEKSIEWARHPEMMQRLKLQRDRTADKTKQQQQQ